MCGFANESTLYLDLEMHGGNSRDFRLGDDVTLQLSMIQSRDRSQSLNDLKSMVISIGRLPRVTRHKGNDMDL